MSSLLNGDFRAARPNIVLVSVRLFGGVGPSLCIELLNELLSSSEFEFLVPSLPNFLIKFGFFNVLFFEYKPAVS